MRPERSRVLLLDVPLALAVGLASVGAAQFAQLPVHMQDGRMGRGFRGPPDFARADVAWPLYLCVALMVVGLALRRIWPRAMFGVVVLAGAGYLAFGGPYGPVLVAPALSVHALATSLPFPRWAPLTVLLVPMLMAKNWDQPYLGLLDPTFYGALVTGFALMVVPAMLALLHRSRRDSERWEREQELRRYAYEERLQIAREVHDVVGHSLSVINLQAGVALHVLGRRPDEVETSLEAIRHTSREALDELRTTLAVFRDPTVREPLAPRPGLARLDDLVAALRAAGREVTVDVVGTDAWQLVQGNALPAAVDQAAYRIIQEALTNVVRHGNGAAAHVRIDRPAGGVTIEIVDRGPRPTQPLVEGGGLSGMRERAQAVGGTLTVSQRPDGEFLVRTELPVPGAEGPLG